MPVGGAGLNLQIAYALAFFVETLLYGVYMCLFVAALPAIAKGRRSTPRGKSSTWIFLVSTILMFIAATIHIAVVVYRFLRSTVLLTDPLGANDYLMNVNNWEILSNIILICIMTWLGDALVIYRAYIVWNRNVWLIALPIGLLLASICVNAYTLVWLKHPFLIPFSSGVAAFNSIYILAFLQNLMTTSLITLKIWTQHRASRAAGVVDRGARGLSLMRVVRIIVESAMVYTVQLLVIIILNFRKDNFQYVVQSAIVPSIGITFVLIAVRVQLARQSEDGPARTNLPMWLDGELGSGAPEGSQRSGITEAKGELHTSDEESITWSTTGAPPPLAPAPPPAPRQSIQLTRPSRGEFERTVV